MPLKDLSHDSLADSKKKLSRKDVERVKDKIKNKVTKDELEQIREDLLDELQAEYMSLDNPALWDGDIDDE